VSRKDQRTAVTVEIAGEKHVLRSEAPAEYTHAVARHVDETVRSLLATQPLELHRVAVLAALHITDELFRTREELRQLRGQIDTRAGLVADRLTDLLAELEEPPAAIDPGIDAPADTAGDASDPAEQA
jgi:cell division protein ZapA